MAETLIQTFLGNVGIGTDDPGSYSLDVNGTASLGSITTQGLTVGGLTNAHVPYGLILIWSGSEATIPSGWALCNGSNGTPDMRNRFVIGGGSTYTAPNATGGANTKTLTISNLPSHSHDYTTGTQSANHVHSVTDPGHGHGTAATDYGGRNDGTTCQAGNFYTQQGFNSFNAGTSLSVANQSANHTHDFTTASAFESDPTPLELRPPYMALCYIMKT